MRRQQVGKGSDGHNSENPYVHCKRRRRVEQPPGDCADNKRSAAATDPTVTELEAATLISDAVMRGIGWPEQRRCLNSHHM